MQCKAVGVPGSLMKGGMCENAIVCTGLVRFVVLSSLASHLSYSKVNIIMWGHMARWDNQAINFGIWDSWDGRGVWCVATREVAARARLLACSRLTCSSARSGPPLGSEYSCVFSEINRTPPTQNEK